MRNIYPEILPESLRELPDLLKGKVSDATEIFLASKCDYDGALACEFAAHLLDEEITSEDTPYSFDERMAILLNSHELDKWTRKNSEEWWCNPIVREKINFIKNLRVSYSHWRKTKYCWYMNRAAHCARNLARMYHKRLEAQEAATTEAASVAEGA